MQPFPTRRVIRGKLSTALERTLVISYFEKNYAVAAALRSFLDHLDLKGSCGIFDDSDEETCKKELRRCLIMCFNIQSYEVPTLEYLTVDLVALLFKEIQLVSDQMRRIKSLAMDGLQAVRINTKPPQR